MAAEDRANAVIGYLKKQGPANTFRMARDLGIKRNELLILINGLEQKGALEFKSGIARFLKLLPEEKKAKPEQKREKSSPLKPRKKIAPKTKASPIRRKAKTRFSARRLSALLESLRAENNQLKQKLSESGETIKILEEKASHPRIITRTVIKEVPVIKKVPVVKRAPVEAEKKWELPKLKLPKLALPKLKIPKLKLPKLKIPKLPRLRMPRIKKYKKQLLLKKLKPAKEKPKALKRKIKAWKPKISFAKAGRYLQKTNKYLRKKLSFKKEASGKKR